MFSTKVAFFITLFTFLFTFGLWYHIFWFLTGENNLLNWSWWVKSIYFVVGFSHWNGLINKILQN
jgi:hypothetical protein